jgi:hypothetical protein
MDRKISEISQRTKIRTGDAGAAATNFRFKGSRAAHEEYQYKDDDDKTAVDDGNGATSHCSLFESLDRRYAGRFGTVGKARISGKGVLRDPLSSSKTLSIMQTLLSTQILFADGMSNAHLVGKGYRFFREDERSQ